MLSMLSFVLEKVSSAKRRSQTVESRREDDVRPYVEKIRRLEIMLAEMTFKPLKIPKEKERLLEESWERIKSIEFDLKKTKKVGKN